MQGLSNKKYSKISSALKRYFLENLYYNSLSIKQAAERCKLNYSTAKIILRDLNHKERKFVRRLIRKKETNQGIERRMPLICSHVPIEVTSNVLGVGGKQICVISRVEYDFFSCEQKSQQMTVFQLI